MDTGWPLPPPRSALRHNWSSCAAGPGQVPLKRRAAHAVSLTLDPTISGLTAGTELGSRGTEKTGAAGNPGLHESREARHLPACRRVGVARGVDRPAKDGTPLLLDQYRPVPRHGGDTICVLSSYRGGAGPRFRELQT